MSRNVKRDLKVSVSGVRGIIGESFSPGLAAAFTAAFGQYVGGGKVIVGRDTRPTGEMIEHAVVASLLSVGCQPVLAGMVPTPTVQILVEKYQANGGIVITASHNPVEWNAMKFIGPSGTFLNYNESAALQDIYNQPDFSFVGENDYRKVKVLKNPFDAHQELIFSRIDVEAIRRCRFRVAIDCCNGTGAIYTRPFLEALGCEVFAVNDKPDGVFARGPEPTPENLKALSAAVIENRCHIGFAQDPDADRIGIVRCNGEPVSEQYALVLAAEHVLSETPGPVVANIQTTKALEDVAATYGCEVIYSQVGEINVTEKMLQTNAVIGGEGSSGGVIYPTVYPCRDSFTAMALMLEMLSPGHETIDEIVASLPQYSGVTRKYACSAANARNIVSELRQRYREEEPITIDGIRINFASSWVLIRPSNTEAVLRLTVEATSKKETEAVMARFHQEITGLLQS